MIAAPFKVVLDANVLFPFTLRDTLLRAAELEFYQIYWSDEILGEMERNLVSTRRMDAEKASRLRQQMSKIFPEALVSGYEPLVDSMPNHSKDRHVAAAAVKIGAQVIVTSNLKDFRVLPEGIEAQSPDDFLCNLFDLDEEGMIGLLERQAADLVKPERTLDELLNGLRKTVPSFAEAVMERLNDETEGGWFRR